MKKEKKIEILVVGYGDGFIAVTSVKEGNELKAFFNSKPEKACVAATDYALENNYDTVNIITANSGKDFEKFVIKHLAE